jgi:hypothetical protein
VIYFKEVFVKEKLSKYIANLSTGADKAPGEPRSLGRVRTYEVLKFVMTSFGQDSVQLSEGHILYPCCEIWE